MNTVCSKQSNTTYRCFQLITVLIRTDRTKNNPNDNEDSSHSRFGLWKDSGLSRAHTSTQGPTVPSSSIKTNPTSNSIALYHSL